MSEGQGNTEKSVSVGDLGSGGVTGKSVMVSIREQLNAFRRTTSQNNAGPCMKAQQITQRPNVLTKSKHTTTSSSSSTISPENVRQEMVEFSSEPEKEMKSSLIAKPIGEKTNGSIVESQPKDDGDNDMELSSADIVTANAIRPIDRGVVHQICSGQVIVTLSTAVKELVENSLDAGSTKIDIRLQEYGSKLIEVSDDGNGIEESNFEGLALKHHTSKISVFEDLTGLTTFGFRGEALSSLCALSRLTVTTRHKSSGQRMGHKLDYDYNGKITSRTNCARESGTTVMLKDLFHTLPVRHREFMKNLKREFHKMVNVLYGYCLVVNGTRFSCSNQVGNSGPTKVIGVPSYSTMKERIVALFGSKQFSSLLEIKQCDTVPEEILSEFDLTEKTYEKKYEIEGYISIPNHGRSSNDRQFFFINSRPCDPAKIGKVINEVYHSFSRHQNPFVCLHVKTNREDVDVNVTPDKRTLYVRNEKILLATLKATLVPLLTVAASSYNPNHSQLSSQLKLSFNAHSESQLSLDDVDETEEDDVSQSSTSRTLRGQPNWSQGSQKSFNSQGLKVFDRQCSGSGGRLSKSAGIGDFLSKFKSDSSTGKRQRSWDSSSRDCKTPKLTNYLKKYDAPEKQTMCQRNHQNGPEEPFNDEDGFEIDDDAVDEEDQETVVRGSNNCRFKKSDEISVRERESEDMEVIFDDDNSEGSAEEHTTNFRTIKVSVNWQELSSKLASMKVKNESSHSSISYSRRFRAKIAPEDNSTAEEELKKQLTQDMFSKMEILGQFNLGFIVVKNGPDLFIVDQHASDEKFNFEDLQNTTVMQSQPLIRPLDLQLPAISENIIMDNIETFQKNGFDFIILPDEMPTERVKLSRIPYSKNTEFGKADVEELVFMMEDATDKSFYRPTKVREMLASRACRKSVMIGTALSAKEMRAIVNHMGEMAQPWNCPHGRPTIRHLINLNILPDMDETKFLH